MIDASRLRLAAATEAALLLSWALSGLAYGSASRVARISAELQRAPVHRSDAGEDPAARAARIRGIAEALAEATGSRRLVDLLLAVGRHESHWARAVGEGDRTGDDGLAWG